MNETTTTTQEIASTMIGEVYSDSWMPEVDSASPGIEDQIDLD